MRSTLLLSRYIYYIMEHRAFSQDNANNGSNLQACVMVQMIPSNLERQLYNFPLRASHKHHLVRQK